VFALPAALLSSALFVWPSLREKIDLRSGVIVLLNHFLKALVSSGNRLAVGSFSKSGSLAIFAAIGRASSFVSSLAADKAGRLH
jgi:hypothetical protein